MTSNRNIRDIDIQYPITQLSEKLFSRTLRTKGNYKLLVLTRVSHPLGFTCYTNMWVIVNAGDQVLTQHVSFGAALSALQGVM